MFLGRHAPHRRADGSLAGRFVGFTGMQETMTRPEAQALAEQLGAKVTDSVSEKTDLVVVGADAGCRPPSDGAGGEDGDGGGVVGDYGVRG
jgi:NAD-dependent DNA ligase